jgi:hypothetical protein
MNAPTHSSTRALRRIAACSTDAFAALREAKSDHPAQKRSPVSAHDICSHGRAFRSLTFSSDRLLRTTVSVDVNTQSIPLLRLARRTTTVGMGLATPRAVSRQRKDPEISQRLRFVSPEQEITAIRGPTQREVGVRSSRKRHFFDDAAANGFDVESIGILCEENALAIGRPEWITRPVVDERQT